MKTEPIKFKVTNEPVATKNNTYPIPHKYKAGAKLEIKRLL